MGRRFESCQARLGLVFGTGVCGGGCEDMVNVAQLAEHWVVAPAVAGSSPVVHPSGPRREGTAKPARNGATPPGCAGRVGGEDAGSMRSRALRVCPRTMHRAAQRTLVAAASFLHRAERAGGCGGMADAHALGACVFDVEVRVLSPALVLLDSRAMKGSM